MIVVNSCAVTAEAVAQTRQTIRRLKRQRPAARVIVTGCAAETEPATFANMPEVDRVLSNARKTEPQTWLALRGAFGVRTDPTPSFRDLPAQPRAFLPIQNGCDHRCTFCIIPFGRGPSRSVPVDEVVAQVRALAERGAGEVVLTGVDLTAWGGDLPGRPRRRRSFRGDR
jgi:threonylcarbamoyladenosine tRNA methylthiotransferase MtaB